jgi:hypothetical protein
MGGGGSKPIEDAFCEDGQSIISEIKNIECFSNYKKNEQVYICIIFIILLIISIHFLHRRR